MPHAVTIAPRVEQAGSNAVRLALTRQRPREPCQGDFEEQQAGAFAQPRSPATEETSTIVPPPGAAHVREDQLAEQERGAQVDIQDAVPVVDGDVLHPASPLLAPVSSARRSRVASFPGLVTTPSSSRRS